MHKVIKAVLVLIVVLVLVAFVRDSQLNQQQLELKSIEVKDTSLELKQLNEKYDEELNKSKSNQETIDQLNKEKEELSKQLQAKQEAKAKLAQQKLQTSKTAYAAPVGDHKAFIYAHESGNNPGAINKSSGACGLGQALPCSKMPCSLSDYACQDTFFTNYMLSRYGSWANAYAFWQSHGWW